MDINDPNMIDEELPSVKNFMQNESNLPSINDFISTNGEDDLPSCNEFVEVEEEVIVEEETHEPVDSQNDSTKVIVSLIESLRNSIPEVKSYDKELYELMNRIEEVRKDIPEVKDYDEQISELQESIQEVKSKNFPDFRWIASTFTTIEEDYDNLNSNYDKLNSLLARYKGNFDLEISNIVESIDISKFENDTNYKKVNEEFVTKIDETKKIIDARLKETSKNITSIKKEYKKSDKEIREEIKKEYLRLNEDVSKSLKNLKHSDNSLNDKIDQVNSCFETLKSEIENLPEVKCYDEEIKDVNDSVSTVKNLVKILESKLNKKTSIIDKLNEKISSIEESILVSNESEKIQEDPLTPLDQNFATLNDLSNHYRLFINRIQQQLTSLGGGGETRLEFLDDVDRNSAKVNGKFLKYDSSVGKWVGANASGGAGSQTLDETLELGNTSSTGMSVGVLTASSFVKSGGTSSQFLKADGSVDTSTYLTSYTETQTLDDVLGLGNTSSTGLSVGVVTTTELHVGVDTGFFTEDLVVNGDARITGILSVGTATITLDPDANTVRIGTGITLNANTNSIEVGGSKIADTDGNAEYSGIVTAGTVQVGSATTIHSTGIDLGSGNITSHNINSTGIITATSFVGPVTGDVTGTATTATNLNNQAASYYLDYDNFTNTPTIPTNNNELTNGAGYITTSFTNTNQLTNGAGFVTFTNNNQLTNGAGYITTSFTNTNQLTNGAGFITTSFTNTNQLTNGAGFITSSDDITGTSGGLTGSPSITVTDITAVGNVSIAGTLTYEDVTNVDSIGIATARTGLKVLSGGINVTGVSTFNSDIDVTGHTETDTLNVSGVSTFVGDANFDNATLYVDSTNNRIGVGLNNPAVPLHMFGSYPTLKIQNSATAQYASASIDLQGPAGDERYTKILHGNSNTGGTETYFQIEQYDSSGSYVKSLIQYNYEYDYWALYAAGTERLRVNTSGIDVTGHTETDTLNVSGVSTFTNKAEVRSDDGSQGRIDFYCEVNNAHYTRVQAAAHSDYSGIATVTLPSSSGTLLLTDGDGSSLTSLNASNLGSGTIPDARFPATLPAVSGQNLTGIVTGITAGSNITVLESPSGNFIITATGGGGGDTVSINATATDILSVSSGDISADDAGADKLVFWDDSESKLTYLTAGSGLSISGTTITASGGGGSSGIEIENNGTSVGTGITAINFSTNVTATASGGIATVTASGGGGGSNGFAVIAGMIF